jgi:hypothetical protein
MMPPDFPGARVVRHTYVSDPLKALKSRVRGRGGGVSIRFPGEPSALERGPLLLLRKEATFSPRSPRKSLGAQWRTWKNNCRCSCGRRLRPRARARARPRPPVVRAQNQFAEVASNDAPDFPGARVVRYTYVSDPLKAQKSSSRTRRRTRTSFNSFSRRALSS